MRFKKAKAFLFLALVLGSLSSLFGAPAAEQGFPRTIDAGKGRTLRLERPPQRIVSVAWAVDEILSALVDKSRVQAVTQLSLEPTISNIIGWAQGIPHKIQADVEQILACEPDIVFALASNRKEFIKLLLNAQLPVVEIETQDSIAEVQSNIRKIGHAIGEDKKAEAVIADMNRKLAGIEAKMKTVKGRPRVMTYSYSGGTSGKGRTTDDFILRGGGVNIAAEKGLTGTVKVSEETLIEWDPEVILLSGYSPGKETFPDELRANPALQTVNAIKNNRVYVLPGKYFQSTSQYSVQAVEAVARLLHPEIFNEKQ